MQFYMMQAYMIGNGELERREEARAKGLRRSLKKVELRQERLIQSLEREDDPDGMISSRMRVRLAELEEERRATHDELRNLEGERDQAQPGSADFLDALPLGDAELESLPEEALRRLFEAFRLRVRYDPGPNTARCRVAISTDSVDALRIDVALAVRAPNWTVSEKLAPFDG